MNHRRALQVVVALVLGLSSGAGAQTADVDLKKLQEQHRKKTEQEGQYKDLQVMPGAMRVREICQVACKDGVLDLTSRLPATFPTKGAVRVEVEGLDGFVVVQAAAAGTGMNLYFTRYDWSDAQAFAVMTRLWGGGQMGSVSISREWVFPDSRRLVALAQHKVFDQKANKQRPEVTFQAYQDHASGQRTLNISLSAADFPTLRRQQPAVIDEYLRPLLHDLQMESLLVADPLLAAQVLAGDLPVDPAVKAQVEKLLPQLDADVYADREKALAVLGKLGPAGALVVRHMDRTKLSDQQNTLLDTFLGPFTPVEDSEARRLGRDPVFLVDCLYCEEGLIRKTALAHLERIAGGKLGLDTAADPATQADAIEGLRARLASATQPTTRPQ